MDSNQWHIKWGAFFIKIAIVVISVYFIYVKVISRPDFDKMVKQISETFSKSQNIPVLAALITLMGINWLFETAKWKLLLKRIQPVSWILAFRSVLSGVTISVFTPNRMGEFAGKVMHLESGIRVKAALASVIGSMNQLLITIVAGGIGLLFSLENFDTGNSFLYRIKFLLIFIGIIASVFIYFRIPSFARVIGKIKKLRKINLYIKVFTIYPFSDLLKLTVLSSFRYLIFTFQFFMIMKLFDINFSYHEAMRLISLIYLVMAVVPSIALSELTVRGSVALYFLSPLTGNTAGILAASSFLWFLNLIVPALLGALAAFYFRFNK